MQEEIHTQNINKKHISHHHGLFPCNGSMSVTETQGAVVIKAN
eukprot:COSAG01_NODE_3767_length_5718_cov_4.404342_1_plen_42_part_10